MTLLETNVLFSRHTADLAQAVVDANAVPLLVLCVQEPEIALKRISASALSEICKHTPDLAQAVVDAGATPFLSSLISHNDAQLKKQVCSCLAQIAKHNVELAGVVVEAEIFPKILNNLKVNLLQISSLLTIFRITMLELERTPLCVSERSQSSLLSSQNLFAMLEVPQLSLTTFLSLKAARDSLVS